MNVHVDANLLPMRVRGICRMDSVANVMKHRRKLGLEEQHVSLYTTWTESKHTLTSQSSWIHFEQKVPLRSGNFHPHFQNCEDLINIERHRSLNQVVTTKLFTSNTPV